MLVLCYASATIVVRLSSVLQGCFRLERLTYASIQQMITSLQQTAEPVTHKSGAVLKTAISRPHWMLHNDDVNLQLKIGSVCICSLDFTDTLLMIVIVHSS